MTLPIVRTGSEFYQEAVYSDAVSRTVYSVNKPSSAPVGDWIIFAILSNDGFNSGQMLPMTTNVPIVFLYTNFPGHGADGQHAWFGMRKVTDDEPTSYIFTIANANTADIVFSARCIGGLDPALPIVTTTMRPVGASTTTMSFNIPETVVTEDESVVLDYVCNRLPSFRSNVDTHPANSTLLSRGMTRATAGGMSYGMAYTMVPTKGVMAANQWTNFNTVNTAGNATRIILRGAKEGRRFVGYFPSTSQTATLNTLADTLSIAQTEDVNQQSNLITASLVLGVDEKIVSAHIESLAVNQTLDGPVGTNRIGLYAYNSGAKTPTNRLVDPILVQSYYNGWVGGFKGTSLDIDLSTHVGATVSTVVNRNDARLFQRTTTSGFTKQANGQIPATFATPTNNPSLIPSYLVIDALINNISFDINDDDTINIVTEGGSSTLNVSGTTVVTGVTIDGFAVTGLSGSGATYTFDNPALTPGYSIPTIGQVDVVVTTAADGDFTFQVTVNPPADYNAFTLTSISEVEGSVADLIACIVDDQILMRTPEYYSVDVNRILPAGGFIQSDREGSQVIYHRNGGTGVVTEITLELPVQADLTPDSFSFTPVISADLGVWVESNIITISGTTAGADVPVEVTNCEYSIYRAGSWTEYSSVSGAIVLGEQLRIRVMSSVNSSTLTTGTIAIGGANATFSVTTIVASDTTPDAFDFTNKINVDQNTLIESDPVIITGINSVAPLTVAGGLEYSINDGGGWGVWTVDPGTISDNEQLKVRLMSSDAPNQTVIGSVTIGTFTTEFSVTTISAGSITIENTVNAPINSLIISEPFTVIGVGSGSPVEITITNGYLSIDTGSGWGDWINTIEQVNVGDEVRLRALSSGSYDDTEHVIVTIDGVDYGWDIVTRTTPDLLPHVLAFADLYNKTINTFYESNTVVVSGRAISQSRNKKSRKDDIAITISGGTYRKNNQTHSSEPSTVRYGDTIKLGATSSLSPGSVTMVTLTIGGIESVWRIHT